jgi:hypothetical protein
MRRNKSKYNSVKSIVDYLNTTVVVSENKIMRDVFGYDRNNSYMSNKKYADMLRRGLYNGLIRRVEMPFKIPNTRAKYFYYVGNKNEIFNSGVHQIAMFIMQNEAK